MVSDDLGRVSEDLIRYLYCWFQLDVDIFFATFFPVTMMKLFLDK